MILSRAWGAYLVADRHIDKASALRNKPECDHTKRWTKYMTSKVTSDSGALGHTIPTGWTLNDPKWNDNNKRVW